VPLDSICRESLPEETERSKIQSLHCCSSDNPDFRYIVNLATSANYTPEISGNSTVSFWDQKKIKGKKKGKSKKL